MIENRLERERVFHDTRFGGSDNERKKARKYYSVNTEALDKYFMTISKYCNGKRLLEYGCGTGNKSKHWLESGAKVTGIDISKEGIKKAKQNMADTEFDADFFVMDAENTTFEENSFDIIVGTGIIHHLDLKKTYKELSRLLTTEGHIIFIEPLGHNPFINLYRRLTPRMRTRDEHPLRQKDLTLLERYFHNVEIDYFSLFTFLAVPFRNIFLFDRLYRLLMEVDKAVFLFPFLRKYAWTVVIHASNPKK
jgi:SAM-dependent methyltransferase